MLEAAARAVVPGGGLPLVEHAAIAPWSWNQDRSTPFPTPEGALAPLEPALAQWQTERLAAPECQATGVGDRVATVRDHVIAIGRRAA